MSSNHPYRTKQRSDLMEYMETIEKKYPEFTVVREIPRYEAECFGDNNHLNRTGAVKYTGMLKEKYF